MKTSSELLDQAPPNNRDAEMWVVGSAILNPGVLDDLGFLEPEDFYDEFLRDAYQWMIEQRQQGKAIDGGLLRQRFTTREAQADIGEVMQSVPHAGHAKHYAGMVAKLAGFRRAREIAVDMLQQAQTADGDPESLYDHVETSLANVHATPGDGEPKTGMEAAIQASEHLDAISQRGESLGVPTGLYAIDRGQGGLFPGELTILAARPGCGKTSLALQIAYHNAAQGRGVYYSSLEMSATELSLRLACGHAGVSNRLVRTNQLNDSHLSSLSEALQSQAHAKIVIHDLSRQTVATVRRQIHKRAKHGLRLAVVDYLQLLTPDDQKIHREQQVARQVRALKEISREYEIPVLCLCQLNRMVGQDEVPQLHHLRESGSIEQDADVVWFLSRNTGEDADRYNSVLSISKNRNGATGAVQLNFDGPRTCFEGAVGGHNEFSEFGG